MLLNFFDDLLRQKRGRPSNFCHHVFSWAQLAANIDRVEKQRRADKEQVECLSIKRSLSGGSCIKLLLAGESETRSWFRKCCCNFRKPALKKSFGKRCSLCKQYLAAASWLGFLFVFCNVPHWISDIMWTQKTDSLYSVTRQRQKVVAYILGF